jgi:predicted DNA-binding transcriptional regulator YafY
MRRADHLFQIIQILRRSSSPITAAALAAELETSKRSVYRDIASLIGQRVLIRNEAGLGYVLEGGFDLPPLMLTSDKVEAAVLGAQWVTGHGELLLCSTRSHRQDHSDHAGDFAADSYWTRAHARHRAGKLLRMASTLPELATGSDPVERSPRRHVSSAPKRASRSRYRARHVPAGSAM